MLLKRGFFSSYTNGTSYIYNLLHTDIGVCDVDFLPIHFYSLLQALTVALAFARLVLVKPWLLSRWGVAVGHRKDLQKMTPEKLI